VNKIKIIGIVLVIVAVIGLALKLVSLSGMGSSEQPKKVTAHSVPGTSTHQIPHSENSSDITILNTPEVTSQFLPGATFIQVDGNLHSLTEQILLAQGVGYLNVFINGWGTDNPEPSKGQYIWDTLDERVNIMRNIRNLSGGRTKLMISLCCAPDWMKSDSQIDTAPNPQNFADFAELSKQVVLRYPDVKYFQVWNELKGFDKNSSGYMRMYNDVYDAIKSVRPDAQVGGPYIGIGPGSIPDAVTSQWLGTKHGGEVVVVDGGFDSNSPTADFSNAQFYINYGTWLRQQPNGGATLPFGWAEWYPGTVRPWGDVNHFNATMANAMIDTLKGGASYALMWGVEGGITGAYKEGDGQQLSLVDNDQPTVWYQTVKDFYDFFGPGTPILQVKYRLPIPVTVLASAKKTMLVNQLAHQQTLTLNGQKIILNPYQVLVIDTPL
jgi:hypothetical protein